MLLTTTTYSRSGSWSQSLSRETRRCSKLKVLVVRLMLMILARTLMTIFNVSCFTHLDILSLFEVSAMVAPILKAALVARNVAVPNRT